MGLFDNPLINLTGLDRPGTPVATMAALSRPGMSGNFGPAGSNYKNPYQGGDTIQMPELNAPDTSGALDSGAKRAESALKKSDSPETPLGFHPAVLDLAKALGGEGGRSDRDMSIAKAGLGMALAGGQTGNFLSALAAGANSGFDEYKNLQAVRAQRAMEQAKFNAENQYRGANLGLQQQQLAQTGNYQQGQLAIAQQNAEVEKAYKEAVAKGVPSEIALREAQAKGAAAQAAAENARAGLYGAQARALTGGDGGIPKAIWDQSLRTATSELNGVAMEPEKKAAEIQRRAFTYSKNTMEARGMPTEGIVFAPKAAAETPVAQDTPKVQPWVGGAYGVAEKTAAEAKPLLASPAVMIPGNRLKEMAQRGSLGAYDPGVDYNTSGQNMLLLKEALQNYEKSSGRAVADQMKTVQELMPKNGVFVSAPENFDKLNTLGQNILQNYLQDTRMAADPNAGKEARKVAEKSAPYEARVLHLIYGDKDPTSFKRFDGPGGRDFSTMSLEDLGKLDPSKLSPDDLKAAASRHDELSK